jgi:hypothetical protein
VVAVGDASASWATATLPFADRAWAAYELGNAVLLASLSAAFLALAPRARARFRR